jgi:PAS domain S-box-containing protein
MSSEEMNKNNNTQSITLYKLRENMAASILKAVVIIAPIGVAFASYSFYLDELYWVIAIYWISLAYLFFLYFWKDSPYALRVSAISGLLYIIGTVTLIQNGFEGGSQTFLLTFVFAAGIFFGRRESVFALIFSNITIVVFAVLVITGIFTPLSSESVTDPVYWVQNIFGQVLLGTLIVVSLNYLIPPLNEAFKQSQELTEELRGQQTKLELLVTRRTGILELASEVSRHLSQVRDLDTLLNEAVQLINQKFELYYTQMYLTDISKRTLVLHAASGFAGEQLLQKRHRLPVDLTSINGTAAAEKRTLIVEDTETSDLFRPNPLLPDTCSEMSVPLIVGDQIIGVIDLQSNQLNKLTKESQPAFEALAGQLAVAIDNTKLYSEAERAREESEAQARMLAHEGWEEFLDAIERSEHIGYTYENQRIKEITQPLSKNGDDKNVLISPIQVSGNEIGAFQFDREADWTDEDVELVRNISYQVAQQVENLRLIAQAEQYRSEAEKVVQKLTQEGWRSYLETEDEQKVGYLYDRNEVQPLWNSNIKNIEATAVQELSVSGEVIGEIQVAGTDGNEDHVNETITLISDQLSAHIDNLRLFDTAQIELEERKRAEKALQKRASELATVSEVSSAVTSLLEPQEILQTVVDMTEERFELYHSHIYLVDDTGEKLVLTAGSGDVGQKMVDQGWEISISSQKSLVALVARTKQGVIVNDVHADPDYLPNDLLPATQAEMAVPLVIGKKVLGVLDVQSSERNHFTKQDVDIQSTLASQVAIALENAQSYASMVREHTLMQTLMDNVPSHIFFKDREHRFIRTSKSLVDVTSLDNPADVISKTDFDIFSEEFAQQTFNDEEEILQTGDPIIGLVEVQTWPDRPDTWKHTSKMPLRDQEGNITGIFGIATDITESKKQEQIIAKRAAELASVAEVSTAITSLLEPQEILQTVVDKTNESFKLYHTQVYLVDDTGEKLVLSSSSGETGTKLVDQGWEISIKSKKSLVASAVRRKEGVIVNDVLADPDYLPNELLPETRSEMAVPMVIGGTVMGVLDVQSTEVDYFTEEDLSIQTTLASQVAIALQNAQSYESMVREHALMQTLMDNVPSYIYFKDHEHRFIRTSKAHAEMFGIDEPSDVISKTDFDFFSDEHAQQAYDDEENILQTGDPIIGLVERETWPDRPDTWVHTTKMPLHDEEGNILGIFGISTDITESKNQEQIIAKRAAELASVAEVSTAITSLLEPQEILQTVVDKTKESFKLYHSQVYLVDETGEKLVLTSGSGETGKKLVDQGWEISIKSKKSLVASAARRKEGVIVNDVIADPDYLPNELLPETCAEMAVPLVIGDTVTGVLDVQSTEVDYFTEEDLSIQTTLASQVAGALQNARQFQQTQKALAETESLYAITSSMTSAFDLEDSLQIMLDQSLLALGLEVGLVSLVDESTGKLYLSVNTNLPEALERKLSNEGLDGTLCDVVYQQQASITVEDFEKEAPVDVTGLVKLGLRSYLGVPLEARGKILGTLCVFGKSPRMNPTEGLSILETAGSQIGIAVENAQLFQQTQRRTTELSILNEMAQKLTSLMELNPIYETLFEFTSRLMDTTNFYIATYYPETHEVDFPITYINSERIEVDRRPVGPGLTDHIIRTKEPLLLTDDVVERMKDMGIDFVSLGNDDPAESWLGVPIIFGDQVIGVIAVQSITTPLLFGEDEKDLLTAVASQAAIAIENARTFIQIQNQAEYESMINSISQQIQSTTTVENALQVTIRELGRALGAKRTSIQLNLADEKNKVIEPSNGK